MKWKLIRKLSLLVGVVMVLSLAISQSGKSTMKKVDTDGDGIPENKPQAVSTDTIQVTDITRSGKGEFTLVINGSLVINGFRKMSGQRGEWVVMPGYQTKDGKYKNLIYPIGSEASTIINDAILRGIKNPGAQGSIVVNEDKIKLYKSAYPGKTKAYGTITINNSLAVMIKVLEGQYGPWVALPTKKGEDGQYYDVAYSIAPQATEAIKKAKEMILKKYKTIK